MQYTTHLNLKKPEADNFVSPDPFNDNADTLDTYLYDQAQAIDAAKANKPTKTTGTLLAANWGQVTKMYSFESTYPVATYDLEIEPSNTCTEEQLDAWDYARILGSALSNVLTALGDVPSVDIPIIIKAVVK